jgi:hypothetical protein
MEESSPDGTPSPPYGVSGSGTRSIGLKPYRIGDIAPGVAGKSR